MVDIILGRPWLVQHNPILSWKTGEVLKWGDDCFSHCFPHLPRPSPAIPVLLPIHSMSIESPVEKQSVDIPSCYAPFSDVFCPRRAAQLPLHRPWDCAIDLISGEPVPHGKIYPLSLPEQKAMEEYIEEALKQGYIVYSTSPAAFSFFVAKKDGGLRPCIDYRQLNKITVKFRYPLPLVPAALEQLRSATIFTKLDLRSAYNIIRIRKGDIVYIDDILIYFRSLAEHRRHVAEVLKQLRKFHLYLKADKCTFHQPSVHFLRYIINSGGIRMAEGKVEAISSWPLSTTIKELQWFLGFSNFYRRFIANYSSITSPLTDLLKGKAKSLSWNPVATEAFNTLKKAFTSAPLLVHPNPELLFVVDAKRLNPRQARWALFFTCFHFKISYQSNKYKG